MQSRFHFITRCVTYFFVLKQVYMKGNKVPYWFADERNATQGCRHYNNRLYQKINYTLAQDSFSVRFAFAITISGSSSPNGLISKLTIGGFLSFKNPICSRTLK